MKNYDKIRIEIVYQQNMIVLGMVLVLTKEHVMTQLETAFVIAVFLETNVKVMYKKCIQGFQRDGNFVRN